jgi:nucleoside-diphosphate-sugar epimerase
MTGERVFVAGASGAVGLPMCRLLVDAGWTVVGATRSPHKAAALRAMGVTPVVVDVFDAAALTACVVAAQPRVVVHQLTDLPDGLDPAQMPAALARNARIREEGTRNLVQAALAAGADRLVAQSIAFVYAPGPQPWTEDSALIDPDGGHPFAATARAVASLERQVLEAALTGIVLRYGRFYGPGTGFDAPAPSAPLHVEAAADAACRAMAAGRRGVYNIAEADGAVSSAKAVRELGWSPAFRARPAPPAAPPSASPA